LLVSVRFSQDIVCLQESSGNDKEFEKELLDAYLESCEPHLNKLPELLRVGKRAAEGYLLTGVAATQGKNKKDAHFHTHTIKGSSLQIGGTQVGHAAHELEVAIAGCADGGDLTAAQPALEELQKAFSGFVKAFREYLA
jgi:HPt (histidine-containing phosphotransfer) domain-containing protein